MEKVLAVLVGLCCVVAFSSVSMAAPAKPVKAEVPGARSSTAEDARKKIGPNIKRSSEHGSVRGTINGGGSFI